VSSPPRSGGRRVRPRRCCAPRRVSAGRLAQQLRARKEQRRRGADEKSAAAGIIGTLNGHKRDGHKCDHRSHCSHPFNAALRCQQREVVRMYCARSNVGAAHRHRAEKQNLAASTSAGESNACAQRRNARLPSTPACGVHWPRRAGRAC
jgi:hypothetical protein